MNNNLKKYFFMSGFLLFASSCAFSTQKQNSNQRFTIKQLEIANNLAKKNSKAPLLKRTIEYHNSYYLAVHNNLENLLNITSSNLKNKNLDKTRKSAIKYLNSDADLMDEVKKYSASLDNINDDEVITRFASNRTPLILRKAAKLLENDDYFNAIIAGKFPDNFKFSWNSLTFLSGVENFDDKGTIAVSALAASIIYLLDENELKKNLYNHSSVIYNERVTELLTQNPKLLAKLQKDYHLFSGDKNIISKIYEGYEFGGDKDLKRINNPKFVPLDCATGIDYLLGIKKDQFFTYHLASYHNEFFKQNAAYWKFNDWKVREQIAKKLKPIKPKSLNQLKPGNIIAWRDLNDKTSLIDPKGYVGNAGHIGIILGFDGDDLYYISWTRDLESKNKSGMGIDALSISRAEKSRLNNKLAIFAFEVK